MKRQSCFRVLTVRVLFIVLLFPAMLMAQKTSLVRVHENVRETPYPQKEHT